MNPKKLLKSLFLQALGECAPERAVRDMLSLEEHILTIRDHRFDLRGQSVYLFAVGKASVPMFEGTASILGGHIKGSLVITSDTDQGSLCGADQVMAGDHPIPKENSLQAGKAAAQFIEDIPKDALVLSLISGGTSSLMSLPPDGVSIEHLSHTYELLNNSGATIREINTVRKHCSQIKGGQLLRFLSPDVTLIDLVISDVPDDDLAIVGSGSTMVDGTTYQDAYHILLEYELWDQLDDEVRNYIEKGINGQELETVSPNEDLLKAHHSYVISSAGMLAQKIAELASRKNIKSWVAREAFNEDVEKVAEKIAGKVLVPKKEEPRLYIFYGESTVDVRGSGKGGRNQELALRGALQIEGHEDITWLSAGTDGVDGPTDAAGAIVDGNTISMARGQGVDPYKYLAENDSYHFHGKLGSLFKTGPTGNNLMDVVLVWADQ